MPLNNRDLDTVKIRRIHEWCIYFSQLTPEWKESLDGLRVGEKVVLYLDGQPANWLMMRRSKGGTAAGLKIAMEEGNRRAWDSKGADGEFNLSLQPGNNATAPGNALESQRKLARERDERRLNELIGRELPELSGRQTQSPEGLDRGKLHGATILMGNFKAFRRLQRIPIKPLTLIFGPNSAGKSSVIHGLLLAKEIFGEGATTGNVDVRRTAIGGDTVDLGGFSQFVHGRDGANPRTTTLGIEFGAKTARPSDQASLEVLIGESCGNAPRIATVTLRADLGTVVLNSDETGGSLLVKSLDFDSDPAGLCGRFLKVRIAQCCRRSRPPPDDRDLGKMFDLCRALIKDGSFKAKMVRNLPSVSANPGGFSHELWEFIVSRIDPVAPFRGLKRGVSAEEIATDFVRQVAMNVMWPPVSNYRQLLDRLRYLGPLRSYPERDFAYASARGPNWTAGGGDSWERLVRDPELRGAVNSWLGSGFMKTPYELRATSHYSLETIQAAIEEYSPAVHESGQGRGASGDTGLTPEKKKAEAPDTEIARRLDAQKVGTTVRSLILFDKARGVGVSHRDVGIGVSQVLPVLAAAYGSKDKLWAIEQPEIHLHPALQSELADVFIESAKTLGNTFVLETHSEHLILRVMRRIRETNKGMLPPGKPPLTPGDVAVLYVEPQKDGSVVRELQLAEDGSLLDAWPGGFFEEGFRERFG